MSENCKCPFFKTKTGRFITTDEMTKAAEIIWGENPDFYMDWYEIRDKIGAVEMTAKQTYDIALNKGDKILAIKAYRAMKAEQGDRFYSLIKAKEHVEEVLERKEKRKAYITLYHEIQEKFCDHVAFITHWEILGANAKDIYRRLKKEYGDKKESVTEEVVLDYICNLHKCSRACAKEVFQVMTLNSSIIKKGEVWGFMQ